MNKSTRNCQRQLPCVRSDIMGRESNQGGMATVSRTSKYNCLPSFSYAWLNCDDNVSDCSPIHYKFISFNEPSMKFQVVKSFITYQGVIAVFNCIAMVENHSSAFECCCRQNEDTVAAMCCTVLPVRGGKIVARRADTEHQFYVCLKCGARGKTSEHLGKMLTSTILPPVNMLAPNWFYLLVLDVSLHRGTCGKSVSILTADKVNVHPAHFISPSPRALRQVVAYHTTWMARG